MAVVSKLTSLGRALKQIRRNVALTLSGNYAAGGQVVDLTALTNPNGIDGGKQFSRIPEASEILNGPIGWNYQWVPGLNLATGKLKILDEATGVELVAGAYPAGLTGADAITMEFIFKALV